MIRAHSAGSYIRIRPSGYQRIPPPCAVCHDAKGTGQNLDIHALAGKNAAYLPQTPKGYKSGALQRSIRTDAEHLKLNTKEIAQVARYCSGMAR